MKLASINKIFKAFSDFASNHSQIKTFSSIKEESQIAAANWEYPILFSTIRGAKFGEGLIYYTMDIYFLDRLKPDGSNYLQIISDQLLIAYDFYTQFNDHRNEYDFWIRNNEPDLTATIGSVQDNTLGWKLSIDILTQGDRNENQIPFS